MSTAPTRAELCTTLSELQRLRSEAAVQRQNLSAAHLLSVGAHVAIAVEALRDATDLLAREIHQLQEAATNQKEFFPS